MTECGLFVDIDCPYLGATPDGLIEDGMGIVEVKGPKSCENLTPEESITSGKFRFWTLDKEKKAIVNKRNAYFFQIQGQMHITRRKYCLFVLWTRKGLKYEKVDVDDSFWNNIMKQKLQDFYFDCMLPELVDPRFTRSMEIRDPLSILQAMQKKKEATKRKR